MNNQEAVGIKKQELAREEAQRAALKSLAGQWQTPGFNPQEGLSRYGQITGDLSPLIKSSGLGGIDAPSAVREYEYFSKLNPEQKQEYLTTKRASKYLDLGGEYAQMNPTGAGPLAVYGKTLAPGERPETKGAQQDAVNRSDLEYRPAIKAAESRSLFEEEGLQGLPLVQRSLESQELRDGFLDEKINSIESRASGFTTGFGGALLNAIPGTPAYDLKADVETLLANSGFDRLQEMRDNSPTGGALGQVSERELGLLQASAQNLMQSQSKAQFLRNLKDFKEQRRKSLANVRKAYEEDYKRFGGEKDPYLPKPGQKKPKRYNPATGRLE